MITITSICECKISDDKRHMHLKLIKSDGENLDLALPQADLYRLLSSTIRCVALSELGLGLGDPISLPLVDGDVSASKEGDEIVLVLQLDQLGDLRFIVPRKLARKLAGRLAEAGDHVGRKGPAHH